MKKQPPPNETVIEIVHIDHGKPFTDTLTVALGVKLEHASVIRLVRRHRDRFEKLGKVRFQIALNKKGSATEYADLNEDQATFLMTLFRNTEVVLDFKLKLVIAFRQAREEIERLRKQASEPAWQFVRDETKVGFKWMTENLKDRREAKGKVTEKHHYTNEVRLINAVLTGKFKGLDRNNLSASDLKLIADMQRTNAMLIAQDMPYAQRKVILMDRATTKIAPSSETSGEEARS